MKPMQKSRTELQAWANRQKLRNFSKVQRQRKIQKKSSKEQRMPLIDSDRKEMKFRLPKNLDPVTLRDEDKKSLWEAYAALTSEEKSKIAYHIQRYTYNNVWQNWNNRAKLTCPIQHDVGSPEEIENWRNDSNGEAGKALDKVLKDDLESPTASFAMVVFWPFGVELIVEYMKASPEETGDHASEHQDAPLSNPRLENAYRNCLCQVIKVNTRIQDLRKSCKQMEIHTNKVQEWVNKIKQMKILSINDAQIQETITTATGDASKLINMMQECWQEKRYKYFTEIKNHIKEFEKELIKLETDYPKKTREFLLSLAEVLYLEPDSPSRIVKDKSPRGEQKLKGQQRDAYDEVLNTAKQAEEPKWPDRLYKEGQKWLEWFVDLEGNDLDNTVDALREYSYKCLSEFLDNAQNKWTLDKSTENAEPVESGDEKELGIGGGEDLPVEPSPEPCEPDDKHDSRRELAGEDMPQNIKKMRELHSHLKTYADKVQGWLDGIKEMEVPSVHDVEKTINAAQDDTSTLTDLIQMCCEKTGCKENKYNNLDDVENQIDKLERTLKKREASCKKNKTDFLDSLVQKLESLEATAGSQKLKTQLKEARTEVEQQAKTINPLWSKTFYKGDAEDFYKDGSEWWNWILGLFRDERDAAIQDLDQSQYKDLAYIVDIYPRDLPPVKPDNDWPDHEPIPIKNDTEANAFNGNGAKIPVQSTSDDDVLAALRDAFSKWGMAVTMTGSDEFKDQARRVALKNGIIFGDERLLEMVEAKKKRRIDQVNLSEVQDKIKKNKDKIKKNEYDWGRESNEKIAEAAANFDKEAIAELAARLAHDGKYDLAFHLTQNAERLPIDMTSTIPSWVYGYVACGSSTHNIDYTVVKKLYELYHHNIDDGLIGKLNPEDQMAIRLMIACGSLLPAIFAEGSCAVEVLNEQLNNHMFIKMIPPSFKELLDTVKNYGEMGIAMSPHSLQSSIGNDDLKLMLDEVMHDASEWLENADNFGVSGKAKNIWIQWKNKSKITEMLKFVESNNCKSISSLKQFVEEYKDPENRIKQICTEIQDTDKSHTIGESRQNKINRQGGEAIKIINRYIGFQARRSLAEDTEGKFHKLQKELLRCFKAYPKKNNSVADLTEKFSNEEHRMALRAAVKTCGKVIGKIESLLSPNVDSNATIPLSANQLLNNELLKIPHLLLGKNGEPRLPKYTKPSDKYESSNELSRNLVQVIAKTFAEAATSAENSPSLLKSAIYRGKRGDLESMMKILEIMEDEGDEIGIKTAVMKSLEIVEEKKNENGKRDEERDEERDIEWYRSSLVGKHKDVAQTRIDEATQRLADALRNRLFDRIEHQRWSSRLANANRDFNSADFLCFIDIRTLCEQLLSSFTDAKKRESDMIREEFAELQRTSLKITKEDADLMDRILNAGDFNLARKNIGKLSSGESSLSDENATTLKSPFEEFFCKKDGPACELIYQELRNAGGRRNVIERIEKRRGFAGLDLSDLDVTADPSMDTPAKFLDRWFEVKDSGHQDNNIHEEIRNLLLFIGLSVSGDLKPLTIQKHESNASYIREGVQVTDTWEIHLTAVLSSRDICPNPTFGSIANGRYIVMCYWGHPNTPDFASKVNSISGNPVIVFCFRSLGSDDRKKLTQFKDVLLIDDVLAVFLATCSTNRLRTLFMCTLPFANVVPYSQGGGFYWPEMFYGRSRELARLKSTGTDSSCLVYGGRQTGKTLLLRRVAQEFNETKPEGSRVAVYIDLKGMGMTAGHPEKVWKFIAEALADREVIDRPKPNVNYRHFVEKQINACFQGSDVTPSDDTRVQRILVLLDECEEFLAGDLQSGEDEYRICDGLWNLMNTTEKKFKIIIAGLHNVQKSAGAKNFRFAHFGNSLCIGPLDQDNNDLAEARALIVKPLETTGCYFEHDFLVDRILDQTNYYPSLIHHYCDCLLNHLRLKNSPPPYIVTSDVLDAVYNGDNLRSRLAGQFDYTLRLDLRFKLIAYILALYDPHCESPMDDRSILKEASDFWPEYFGTNSSVPMSPDSFKNLLLEMVGMGILVATDRNNTHFTLRNSEVASLIKSFSDVDTFLESPKGNWRTPDNPSYSRTIISDQSGTSSRSVLTPADERQLELDIHQIIVVCGCKAGNVDNIELTIKNLLPPDSDNVPPNRGNVRVMNDKDNLEDFKQQLTDLQKRGEGTTVLLVPNAVNWDDSWIDVAYSRQRSRYTTDKCGPTCIAFISEPNHLLYRPSILKKDCVKILSVEPWDDDTFDLWINKHGNIVAHELHQGLKSVTGYWPKLLDMALEEIHSLINRNPIDVEKRLMETIFRLGWEDISELFGLPIHGPAQQVLEFLCAKNSPVKCNDICKELSPPFNIHSTDHDSPSVDDVLRWAQSFRLVKNYPDALELDVAVRHFLSIGKP
jgi:hypothetical protein